MNCINTHFCFTKFCLAIEFILIMDGVASFYVWCYVITQLQMLLLIFYLGYLYDEYLIQYSLYYWFSVVFVSRCYIIGIQFGLSYRYLCWTYGFIHIIDFSLSTFHPIFYLGLPLFSSIVYICARLSVSDFYKYQFSKSKNYKILDFWSWLYCMEIIRLQSWLKYSRLIEYILKRINKVRIINRIT